MSDTTPVLAWYKEVVREAGIDTTDIEYLTTQKFLAILAKHDPHAETVRLLEEAVEHIEESAQYAAAQQWALTAALHHMKAAPIRTHLSVLKEGTK